MPEIGKILNNSGTTVCRMFISEAARCRNRYRNHKHTEFEISLILKGNGLYVPNAAEKTSVPATCLCIRRANTIALRIFSARAMRTGCCF